MTGDQRGASLLVTLILLAVVSLLGMSAAQMVRQAERAARADRDRAIALAGAEQALLAAESDIAAGAVGAGPRGAWLTQPALQLATQGCAHGALRGLCGPSETPLPPADFLHGAAGAASVPAGGQGAQPARYVIEAVTTTLQGHDATRSSGTRLRITAIGYGPRPGTQVVLQLDYRLAL